MRILVLDDDPRRHAGFRQMFSGPNELVHVETHDEACAAMEAEQFDLVFFDHDLNDYGYRSTADAGMYGVRELTGVDVAAFAGRLPEEKRPKQAIVHSWNPDGARRIQAVLREAGIPSVYEPFSAPVCLRCSQPISEHAGNNRDSLACPEREASVASAAPAAPKAVREPR